MATGQKDGTANPSHIYPSLRIRGVIILVLIGIEVYLGSQLAASGSPYPIGWLLAHILVGLFLLAFSGHSLGLSLRRSHKGTAKGATALTFLGSVGAVLAGFTFLFAGQSYEAFFAMEILAFVALIGSVLMIVFGSNN